MKLEQALEISKTKLFKAIEIPLEIEHQSLEQIAKLLGVEDSLTGLIYQIFDGTKSINFLRESIDFKGDRIEAFRLFAIVQLKELNDFHDDKELAQLIDELVLVFENDFTNKSKLKELEEKLSSARYSARYSANSAYSAYSAYSASYSASYSAYYSASY